MKKLGKLAKKLQIAFIYFAFAYVAFLIIWAIIG
jgi:hypothetical protein